MTTYYKQVNESGEIILLLTYDFMPKITNPLIVEVTKEEYEVMRTEIVAKSETEMEQSTENEISSEEFIQMIEEVL